MALTRVTSQAVKDGTLVNADIKSDAAIAFSKMENAGHAPGLRETTGPTNLTLGDVKDGQQLIRSGTTLVGQFDWVRKFLSPGRKRWRQHPNANAANSRLATGCDNAAFSGSPGTSTAEAEGIAFPLVTGATSGNSTGGPCATNGDATSSSVAAQVRHKPTFFWRFKTGSNITNYRLFVGCSNAAVGSSDSPTTPCVMLRYSTGAGDSGFVVYSYDGSTGSASSQVGSIAADTEYWLAIDFPSTSQCDIYLGTTLDNMVLVLSKTSNLPASTSFQNSNITLTTLTNATRTVKMLTAEGATN